MRQLVEMLSQDLRYALRGLRKSPGFAAAVIVTLGLGIGANVAMFGVVDRLMFRPYPYLKDPGTVHRVYMRSSERGFVRTQGNGYEYTRYEDFRKWTTSFSPMAAFANQSMAVGVGEAATERRVAQVSGTFFDFFNARPALGRFFVPAEDTTPRGAEVVVLGYAFWQKEFGGRNVIGEGLIVGNIPTTIIGVAPEGFIGVMDTDPALYIPITTYAGSRPDADGRTYYTRYDWGWLSMMVRRKPGVSMEQANADATQAARKSYETMREREPNYPPAEIARPHAVVDAMRVAGGPDPTLEARTAIWVAGVALMVLLIACANVANLFLARALRRQREISVRLALGVSRGRLLMQSLTESLVLALIGCSAGMLVAKWGGAAIRRMIVLQGSSMEVFTDWRTIGFAVAAALLAATLTGTAPLMLSRRQDLAKSLKAGSREGTYHRSRLRGGLMILQGALSVALLVGAGLFVRSLDAVKSMRMGYDATPVLSVSRNLRGLELDTAGLIQLRERLLATAQTIRTVEYATYATSVPFWSTSSTGLYITGIDSVRKLGNFTYQTATPDYFKVMDTRIIRGRGFEATDRLGAPRIAVVSEGMARVLWPGKDAIGQCMRVGADTNPCTTVVGIAEDMVQRDITNDKRYHYYLPLDQFRRERGTWLLLRMRGDPVLQGEEVRKVLQQVMPGRGYVVVRPLHEAIDQAQRSWQLGATMFVAFGVLALLVAAIGLYGVIGYNVTQRMHELGVRVALGARSPDILRLVVGQGLRFTLAGIVLGTGLALVASRWLQPLLFKQSAKDPVIYGAVAAVLVLVALIASASPAARAAKADPNTALRAE